MAAEKAEFLGADIAAIQANNPALSDEDALRLAQRGRSAGRFLIATVKGDVHDIGKNIVGVVLACNGFEVTDMGVMVPCDKLLDKAIEIGADVLGLSGLITPSLDEMVHVAKEMERRGFTLPLLVGGATTSAAHTAIKIAEHYSGPVVHVLDASRSVPVTTSLLSADQRDAFVAENRAKQHTLREHYASGPKKATLTLEQARAAAPQFDWANYTPPVPAFLGVRGPGILPAASQSKHPTYISDQRPILKSRRTLPHWTQDLVTYAVTFRLVDSIPQVVIHRYLGEKKQWQDLEQLALSKGDEALAEDARKRHLECYQELIEQSLEEGHGPDWLGNPEIAAMMSNVLQHFDGDRYDLLAWCVMPNHVHAIVRPLGGHALKEILQSWKSFSAKQGNRILNRQGGFWQQESYDHLIRGMDDFYNQRAYILRHRTGWMGDFKQEGCGQDARATAGILPAATETEMDLRALVEYIDWTPFFHTWELRGVWDRDRQILQTKHAAGAAEAALLYQDALAWIERIIAGEHFHARGVYGFFPANADGDDIIVWTDESRTTERCRFHTLRQQLKKDSGKPNVALADWVAPVAAVFNRQAESIYQPGFASTSIEKRTWGSLPHWYQKEATYAVTFRLEDSFPQSVLAAYRKEKDELKQQLEEAEETGDPLEVNRLRMILGTLYRSRIEAVLDEGQGEAWMKDARVAGIVSGSLLHFAGDRYDLGAWCVMPNHVHAILSPKPGHPLPEILHSIKRHSAREANRVLGRSGTFWQKESYDHIIRDPDDYWNQRDYILRNPMSAGLEDWHYLGEGLESAGRLKTAATDFLGGFVVGIHGADALAAELDAAHDPYGAIMVKALADRFAEAFAECLHHRARIAWGYETAQEFGIDSLIHENYRGIRPAPGYPAQPDHTEKPILFELLDATARTGVMLTENHAMHPGAAVCGLYFSHPDSHYFAISELQKDQVEDYARRKGMPCAAVEKWLGPWLGYVP
jgi:REP element-mobilizing transposase RayT/methylmalonyl-CoA mutase cobalamin-binding subunit